MPEFRKIFPSYDWDDVWMVNQIVNQSHVLGAEEAGFVKNVANEKIKLPTDEKVKAWINKQVVGCSCMIIFVGEKTHLSKWVKYEMELAGKRNMGRFLVCLNKMKNRFGDSLPKSTSSFIDPYAHHGMYSASPSSSTGYTIESYSWVDNNGSDNISNWIEDAISRTKR